MFYGKLLLIVERVTEFIRDLLCVIRIGFVGRNPEEIRSRRSREFHDGWVRFLWGWGYLHSGIGTEHQYL